MLLPLSEFALASVSWSCCVPFGFRFRFLERGQPLGCGLAQLGCSERGHRVPEDHHDSGLTVGEHRGRVLDAADDALVLLALVWSFDKEWSLVHQATPFSLQSSQIGLAEPH